MTELGSGATPTPGAAGQPEQLVRSGAILLAKREDPDRIWALVVAGAPTMRALPALSGQRVTFTSKSTKMNSATYRDEN
jgi:hypothetical protein